MIFVQLKIIREKGLRMIKGVRMIKLNRPLFATIEIEITGSLKEVSLLETSLMKYFLRFNYLTTSKDECQNYKMSFTFLLSNARKINKIIDKHAQYYRDTTTVQDAKES